MRPGAVAYENADQANEEMSGGDSAMAIIGTPDDLVETVRRLQTLTGGFGTVIGFVNDWANPEATRRSWDMVARYVIPEVNGMLDSYRESQDYVINHREVFERAGQAVISKIMENERAVKAMSEEANAASAIPAHHAPEMGKKSGS
jgi:limonene 1,2-monooxygenase